MSVASIEERVAALEVEVARLKQQIEALNKPSGPWWQEVCGTFENDPMFEEAMRLGREYRESLRPKASKRAAKQPPKRKKR